MFTVVVIMLYDNSQNIHEHWLRSNILICRYLLIFYILLYPYLESATQLWYKKKQTNKKTKQKWPELSQPNNGFLARNFEIIGKK